MHFISRAFFVIAFLGVIGGSGVLFFRVVPSMAVQDPAISLDMVQSGNTYDETTNVMTLGATEGCLTSATANAATHAHPAHLVIRNVEDLVGWQVRFNYVGDQMRPATVNYAPFTDNNTGQNISFLNLPIDSSSFVHRDLVTAANIPPPPADGSNIPQTALVGAVYSGAQNFEVSPDTPLKTSPDGGGYDAPDGGVLASVLLQVVGDESGQASLVMNLDDSDPNAPGSKTVIFTGSGTTEVDVPATALGDGFHGEGATCVPLDCVDTYCPPPLDITNHTFVQNTPLPASGLHIRFSGAVTPTLVQNASGCPAPTISGDHAAGSVDLDWGELCADGGETVVIEIRSWPPAEVSCSNWSTLGLRLFGDCDAP